MKSIEWNGTGEEAIALLNAVTEHCECKVKGGKKVGNCASHEMLAKDQWAVDHLLFMKRIAKELIKKEFNGEVPEGVNLVIQRENIIDQSPNPTIIDISQISPKAA